MPRSKGRMMIEVLGLSVKGEKPGPRAEARAPGKTKRILSHFIQVIQVIGLIRNDPRGEMLFQF